MHKATSSTPAMAVLALVATLAVLLSSVDAHEPSENVAIIGAGFSGLSVAYHLLKAGYKNITIYESTKRVGGFVSTFDDAATGVHHDLATYALTATSWKFQDAMVHLGASFCVLPISLINTDLSPPRSEPFELLLIALGKKTMQDPSTYMTQLRHQISLYTILWEERMGIPYVGIRDLRTDRLFPPKITDPDILKDLALPMSHWISKYKLELLEPFFAEATDSQAYGPIQTTAAFYVLVWFPPSLFSSGAVFIPCKNTPSMQALADMMYGSMVNSVSSNFENAVKSVIKGIGDGAATVIEGNGAQVMYDHVIVTTKLPKEGVREPIVQNMSLQEKAAAKNMEELELFSTLMKANRSDAIVSKGFLMVDGEAMKKPSLNTTFWGVLNAENRFGPDEANPYLINTTVTRVSILHYYDLRQRGEQVNASTAEQIQAVKTNLGKWDNAQWEAVQTRTYNGYFQRWRADGITSMMPWTLSDSQGAGGVYYVSAAACGFESVGHVFDCADHLVKEKFV